MKLIRNIVCFIIFLLMLFGILYLSVPKVRQATDKFFTNIVKKDETKTTQTNNQIQIDFENKTIKVEV